MTTNESAVTAGRDFFVSGWPRSGNGPGRPSPFPIRGTPEWEDRERRRADRGCKCISFGRIPEGLGFGETPTPRQKLQKRRVLAGIW